MNKKEKNFLFRIFLIILSIILIVPQILLLIIRLVKGKESKRSFFERFSIYSQKLSKRPIWIHSASIGETIVTFTLIELLIKHNINDDILITTGTLSSADLVSKKIDQLNNKHPNIKVIHQFLPVDNFFIAKIFIDKWNPKISLFIESELWPNIIAAAGDKIKVIIINARMSTRSYEKWKKFGFIINGIASSIYQVLAQSIQDADHFKKLGFNNVISVGNLKYIPVDSQIDIKYLDILKEQTKSRRVIFAASTHNPEEEIIVRVFKNLKKDIKDLLLVIAPRHPIRKDEIISKPDFNSLNISYKSSTDKITENIDIFILDSFGEMDYIFLLKPITFMGGTFSIGGHNILEPAKYESPIIYGPNMSNFQEISEEFIRKKASIQVFNEEELYQKLFWLLTTEKKEIEKLVYSASNIIKEKQGVGNAYVAHILNSLE